MKRIVLDTNVIISAMRSDRGSREKFEAVLRKVPSNEPDPWDRWENAEPFDRTSLR